MYLMQSTCNDHFVSTSLWCVKFFSCTASNSFACFSLENVLKKIKKSNQPNKASVILIANKLYIFFNHDSLLQLKILWHYFLLILRKMSRKFYFFWHLFAIRISEHKFFYHKKSFLIIRTIGTNQNFFILFCAEFLLLSILQF